MISVTENTNKITPYTDTSLLIYSFHVWLYSPQCNSLYDEDFWPFVHINAHPLSDHRRVTVFSFLISALLNYRKIYGCPALFQSLYATTNNIQIKF